MGSGYVGVFFLRHDIEASLFAFGGLVSPTLRIIGLSHLKFLTVLPIGCLKNSLFS